jgi:hypothetical protein
MLGLSAPNIERVVHFDLRDTGREKTHYRSGGPIAAFIVAALRIRRDNHQYGRDDETETDNGVSHMHDHAPGCIRPFTKTARVFGYQRLFQPLPNLARHPFPPRTNLTISNRIRAPMVASMMAEIVPEPR